VPCLPYPTSFLPHRPCSSTHNVVLSSTCKQAVHGLLLLLLVLLAGIHGRMMKVPPQALLLLRVRGEVHAPTAQPGARLRAASVQPLLELDEPQRWLETAAAVDSLDPRGVVHMAP
jgi:hypothetical protein